MTYKGAVPLFNADYDYVGKVSKHLEDGGYTVIGVDRNKEVNERGEVVTYINYTTDNLETGVKYLDLTGWRDLHKKEIISRVKNPLSEGHEGGGVWPGQKGWNDYN